MYENVDLKNSILDNLFEESEKECQQEHQLAEEQLNDVAKSKWNVMNWIRVTLLRKLLGRFKIVITCYYEDKKLFEFEIPKN